MTSKRLSKRQIKEDKVVTGAFRAYDYVQDRSRPFLIAGATIVVLALGIAFVRHGQRTAEGKAGAAYAQANLDFWRGNYPASLSQAQDLLDRSAGTRGGKMAILLLADNQYMTNKFEDALAGYQRFLKAGQGLDPILTRAAKTGVAASLEQLGRYKDAGDAYLDLAKDAGSPALKMDQDMSAARCFHLVKAYDQEMEIYDRDLKEYKDLPSTDLDRVRARLAEARMLKSPPSP